MRWIAEGITELDDLEPWIFWIVMEFRVAGSWKLPARVTGSSDRGLFGISF